MPPTTRTVQLPWLLVPRLPRRPLPRPSSYGPHTDVVAVRGPVSLPSAPCRQLHLFKTARARTTLGQHKVLNFQAYEVAAPSASSHKVNLITSRMQLIEENITIQKLYDEYVKPGHMLYLTEAIKKSKGESLARLKADAPSTLSKNFAIVKAHSTHAQLSKKSVKSRDDLPQFGPLKILNLNLASPPHYAQLTLDRAYRFIEAGCPVEFRTRFAGAALTKAARLQPGDPEVWPWMHDHFPHLRPDFILKAMPEGTMFLIPPVTDNRIVQFVISKKAKSMPQMNLAKRLFTVQKSVRDSIKSGRQAQLPMLMRQQLYEAGQTEYSSVSGIPYERMKEKYGVGFAEADKERAEVKVMSDTSEQRYLYPTAKAARAAWFAQQAGVREADDVDALNRAEQRGKQEQEEERDEKEGQEKP